MFVVYILYSFSLKKHYIGHTGDLSGHVDLHNRGRVRSTKAGIPWVVVYTEECASKQDVYRRGRKIKSYKGGEAFTKLLENNMRVGT